MFQVNYIRWAGINSLWPSDAIWRQGSRSTLVQVMACCLTAPRHYLNQCWLIITIRYSDVHPRAISLEISQPSVTKISLKIIFLRFYWNLPGTSELTHEKLETHDCVLSTVATDALLLKLLGAPSYQYRNSHYKDKMVSRPCYLYIGGYLFLEWWSLYRNGSHTISCHIAD